VLSILALFIASPPGGSYKAKDATTYVAHGHRAAVFVATYLVLIGVLGLICLLARLREAISAADDEQGVALSIFWGTGLVAAASFAIGWCVNFSPPLAYAFASGGNPFSIRPREVYAISEIGGVIVFGGAGILLGLALIALALGARATLPAWLRWLTLIAGILGFASMAFFPWFALPIWSVVVGAWLLVSGRASTSGSEVRP
jgi:hypothetical protein